MPLRDWLLLTAELTPYLDPRVVERIKHEIDWKVRAFSIEERDMERPPEFWPGPDYWKPDE